MKIESLVKKAKRGDKKALESLIEAIQDRIYNLAIRMVGHPADAEDATQEILVKIVIHLGNFRQESAFYSWIYRIASRHLLTARKQRVKCREMSFEQFGEQCDAGLASGSPKSFLEAEQNLLIKEIMISCMQGILGCLDLNLRIAYILGEIFQVTGDEGGYILDITPTAFRKRLSRSRALVRDFMGKKCTLVNPDNPCMCAQQVAPAIRTGRVDPNNLLYATHACHAKNDALTMSQLQELNELERVAALFRNHPNYATPGAFVESVKNLLDSGKIGLFRE